MQLLFHLVYYHSTCFGHGSYPSSVVVYKTVEAATSVCQCVWGGMCTLKQGRVSMRMMLRIGLPSYTILVRSWYYVLIWCRREDQYATSSSWTPYPVSTYTYHLTRIDTHWWLPLQFCILLLKMDTNRVRNM